MAHDGEGGLGLLVHQVRSGELDREGLLRAAQQAGVTEERAAVLAGDALAACENQRRLREQPREAHDFSWTYWPAYGVAAGAGYWRT